MTKELDQNVVECALEGIDGGGKTTQARRLLQHYRTLGLNVVLLSGLSDTQFGQALKRNLDLLNKMGLDGVRFFKEDLKRSYNTLESFTGRVLVFWDRHLYSIYAANTASPTMEEIRQVKPTVPEPRRVFLLNLPIEVAQRRERLAGKADHRLDLPWLALRQERYSDLARREPQRFCIIDANRPPDDVFTHLVGLVGQEIARRG